MSEAHRDRHTFVVFATQDASLHVLHPELKNLIVKNTAIPQRHDILLAMDRIELFIKRWPRTVLLMIAGGIIGYLLWMFIPQQYTAVSKLSVSIDYNRTGKLDDLEQDRLLGITEDILHSDSVMKSVFGKASETDYPTFFETTRTTRTNETWSLAVTGKDPKEAAELSLLWLDTACEALHEAHRHAILAEAYQNELDGLTRCIQNTVQTAQPAGCPDDPESLSGMITGYTQKIQDELLSSGGISTAIRIGEKNPEQLQLRPSSRTAAADTILGAFCGLIISFALCCVPKGNDRV